MWPTQVQSSWKQMFRAFQNLLREKPKTRHHKWCEKKRWRVELTYSQAQRKGLDLIFPCSVVASVESLQKVGLSMECLSKLVNVPSKTVPSNNILWEKMVPLLRMVNAILQLLLPLEYQHIDDLQMPIPTLINKQAEWRVRRRKKTRSLCNDIHLHKHCSPWRMAWFTPWDWYCVRVSGIPWQFCGGAPTRWWLHTGCSGPWWTAAPGMLPWRNQLLGGVLPPATWSHCLSWWRAGS